MKTEYKYWDVLTLFGERETVEIVSSLLQNQSLGCIDIDSKLLLYFSPNKKDEVNSSIKHFKKIYKYDYEWNKQEVQPWHLSWQDNFKPIYINNQIAIIPEWEKSVDVKHTIKIKPGMAFGTGHHETTYLMLERMLKMNLSNSSVLDLGTGSGILSITAKKLGAKKVISIENDLVCKDNFLENLSINKILDISYINHDATKWLDYSFDFVLANINRNILLKIIPNIKNTKARILFSGLLESDEFIINESCKKNGLKVNCIFKRDGWILMDISCV